MAFTAGLTGPEVSVEPGSEAYCELRIRNTGRVVDRYAVLVLGPAAAWTEVTPTSLNLLPDTEDVVRVTFRPPRSPLAPAGPTPYGIRVVSQEDRESSRVEEGVVTVLPFLELSAELVPRTSHGRRTGRHELAVDNRGNQSVPVQVLPSDPDQLLRFRVLPETVDLRPGTATFVRLRARPVRRHLTGPTRTLPFQVAVVAGEGDPVTADGAMVQVALLPAWTARAVALVLVVAAVLVGLWFAVVRPEVHSAATKAVAERTQKLGDDVARARTQASQAAQDASAAKRAASAASASPGPGDGTDGARNRSTGTLPNADDKTAADFRITSSVEPGTGPTFHRVNHTPPKKKVLWITDMVLQNPAGDQGTVQIRRGDTVLLEFGLDNFRDLDYHFVQPLRFTTKDPVVLAVRCRNTGTTACTPSAYFSGQLVTSARP